MDFKIYSLNRYQGGLSYTNWTRLKIVYKDTTAGTQTDKWFLDFKANTPNFVSSVPERNLPLNYVSIDVSDADGNLASTATIVSDPQPLSDEYTNIIDMGDEGTYRVNITYRLDSVLIGHLPDYYNTELIFKMDTIP